MLRHSFAFALPVATESTKCAEKRFYSRKMENWLCTTTHVQIIPDSFCVLNADLSDEVAVVNAKQDNASKITPHNSPPSGCGSHSIA